MNPLEDMFFGKKDSPQKVILDENGRPFSLMHSQLDNSFCSNLIAILIKRFNNYKRNKKVIFNEVFLPAIAIVVGVYIANLQFMVRSPRETLSPSMYPLPQKILFNSEPIDKENSNVSPMTMIENLPDFEASFLPYETDDALGNSKFFSYSNLVYDFGRENCGQEPYHYGSYEIY